MVEDGDELASKMGKGMNRYEISTGMNYLLVEDGYEVWTTYRDGYEIPTLKMGMNYLVALNE